MPAVLNSLRVVWRNRDSWVILGLLGISLSLNVYQALNKGRHASAAATLVVGERASNLWAETTDGHKVDLDWAGDGKPTLLFVFSPSCIWCKRNSPNMEAVAAAGRADYHVVGLSKTSKGLREYLRDHTVSYPIYTNPDPEKSRDFAALATPTTLIISADGAVKHVWRGAYAGKMKEDIEAQFRLKLPGILPADPEKFSVQ